MSEYKRINQLDEIASAKPDVYLAVDDQNQSETRKITKAGLLQGYLENPPEEGNKPRSTYARREGKWVEIYPDEYVWEADIDGNMYVRYNGEWRSIGDREPKGDMYRMFYDTKNQKTDIFNYVQQQTPYPNYVNDSLVNDKSTLIGNFLNANLIFEEGIKGFSYQEGSEEIQEIDHINIIDTKNDLFQNRTFAFGEYNRSSINGTSEIGKINSTKLHSLFTVPVKKGEILRLKNIGTLVQEITFVKVSQSNDIISEFNVQCNNTISSKVRCYPNLEDTTIVEFLEDGLIGVEFSEGVLEKDNLIVGEEFVKKYNSPFTRYQIPLVGSLRDQGINVYTYPVNKFAHAKHPITLDIFNGTGESTLDLTTKNYADWTFEKKPFNGFIVAKTQAPASEINYLGCPGYITVPTLSEEPRKQIAIDGDKIAIVTEFSNKSNPDFSLTIAYDRKQSFIIQKHTISDGNHCLVGQTVYKDGTLSYGIISVEQNSILKYFLRLSGGEIKGNLDVLGLTQLKGGLRTDDIQSLDEQNEINLKDNISISTPNNLIESASNKNISIKNQIAEKANGKTLAVTNELSVDSAKFVQTVGVQGISITNLGDSSITAKNINISGGSVKETVDDVNITTKVGGLKASLKQDLNIINRDTSLDSHNIEIQGENLNLSINSATQGNINIENTNSLSVRNKDTSINSSNNISATAQSGISLNAGENLSATSKNASLQTTGKISLTSKQDQIQLNGNTQIFEKALKIITEAANSSSLQEEGKFELETRGASADKTTSIKMNSNVEGKGIIAIAAEETSMVGGKLAGVAAPSININSTEDTTLQNKNLNNSSVNDTVFTAGHDYKVIAGNDISISGVNNMAIGGDTKKLGLGADEISETGKSKTSTLEIGSETYTTSLSIKTPLMTENAADIDINANTYDVVSSHIGLSGTVELPEEIGDKVLVLNSNKQIESSQNISIAELNTLEGIKTDVTIQRQLDLIPKLKYLTGGNGSYTKEDLTPYLNGKTYDEATSLERDQALTQLGAAQLSEGMYLNGYTPTQWDAISLRLELQELELRKDLMYYFESDKEAPKTGWIFLYFLSTFIDRAEGEAAGIVESSPDISFSNGEGTVLQANKVKNSLEISYDGGPTSLARRVVFDGSSNQVINLTPGILNYYTKEEIEEKLVETINGGDY